MISPTFSQSSTLQERTRVIVTSDGEIDDECSFVRFLLYTNEWDVEAIVTSSSQYHWQGHKWAGDDWALPYLEAYAEVYPNLLKHDSRYPTPEYLKERTLLGNVESEGEMEKRTPGAELITKVLLDESDNRPIWLQAWGGTNTIARALKTIEEEHPEKMAYVANKIRLYLIWEQDETYQNYIKPHWGKYNILTINSDQFIAYFYNWKQFLPKEQQEYLVGSWMNENILKEHGALCELYKAHENGDFRSEGDSPAFLHTIPTGLRSLESPDFGGWGGRYVEIRENYFTDKVDEPGYSYPKGRWWTKNAWGRNRMKLEIPNDTLLTNYMKPMWQWIGPIQNDFAARADWGVKSYEDANHPPVVVLKNELNIHAKAGEVVKLNAKGSSDPDRDKLTYKWWHYNDAGSYQGNVIIKKSLKRSTSLLVPADAKSGDTIHVICEVNDSGKPSLTRYQRTIITVK
ncbi:nucleoside hydrolase-like domain-containing protein [uncultured Arcticibacterium sp.]|uniref:nucleoside hydrolase-like domain-containing protein n=1 Tax=uncultured Arcticibacterium sp. TaxID=2173042 RepID=UPI0030FB1CA8